MSTENEINSKQLLNDVTVSLKLSAAALKKAKKLKEDIKKAKKQ